VIEMGRHKSTDVYVIRDVNTGQLIKFGSKCGWSSEVALKNAFNLHMKSYFGLTYLDDTKGLFDKQTEFKIEVVE
jgi:hypothetical protein